MHEYMTKDIHASNTGACMPTFAYLPYFIDIYSYVYILLMLKRMWKHELCVECLTIMACAILAQALLWVPGTQAD